MCEEILNLVFSATGVDENSNLLKKKMRRYPVRFSQRRQIHPQDSGRKEQMQRDER